MAKPSAPQVTERMLDPQGRINIARTGVRGGLLGDLYLFLLVSSWPRLVVLLATAYLVANSLFAVAYLLEGHSLEHASAGSFAEVIAEVIAGVAANCNANR